MRGHASAALHLLEIGTELIHFYVRHENDVRSEQVRARMADLINKDEVLDRAVNYALHFATRFFLAGRPFADEALAAFLHQQELRVSIPEDGALHARPISLIVKIVNRYETHVEMELDGETCSASSIMELIMVAGNKPHARELIFRGDAHPLADLALLFENGLGENGLDRLPEALRYLKQ
jgi:phosphotransferase system HPr (HPr) family protein